MGSEMVGAAAHLTAVSFPSRLIESARQTRRRPLSAESHKQKAITRTLSHGSRCVYCVNCNCPAAQDPKVLDICKCCAVIKAGGYSTSRSTLSQPALMSRAARHPAEVSEALRTLFHRHEYWQSKHPQAKQGEFRLCAKQHTVCLWPEVHVGGDARSDSSGCGAQCGSQPYHSLLGSHRARFRVADRTGKTTRWDRN